MEVGGCDFDRPVLERGDELPKEIRRNVRLNFVRILEECGGFFEQTAFLGQFDRRKFGERFWMDESDRLFEARMGELFVWDSFIKKWSSFPPFQ